MKQSNVMAAAIRLALLSISADYLPPPTCILNRKRLAQEEMRSGKRNQRQRRKRARQLNS